MIRNNICRLLSYFQVTVWPLNQECRAVCVPSVKVAVTIYVQAWSSVQRLHMMDLYVDIMSTLQTFLTSELGYFYLLIRKVGMH